MIVSANRLELLQIADAVAREKLIDRDIVIVAMRDAIQKAARSRFGSESEIQVEIDPSSGEIKIYRLLKVVEIVDNAATEIDFDEAKARRGDVLLGDFLAEALPPMDFGRIAAQSAKQVIVQKVREAEREQQYEEYKDKVGEIVNGVVKRVDQGNVIVDIGRGEAVVGRSDTIPRETFNAGDRIRGYIYDVRRELRKPQILMSRTHPMFLSKLFTQEVPEIYDNIIEIKHVARDPGSRAKIAVISNDPMVDPVGACVGMRGSRVQAVVGELQGEKIDIIRWSEDPATFIVNSLQPAAIARVVLDEPAHRIEVLVPDEQLSLAIGRRGQNVRLATQLTGWSIDILTEQDESERRNAEFSARTQLFMDKLDVDEIVGQLLASEGFDTIEDVAYESLSEIAAIKEFDEETAEELQSRSKEYLKARDEGYLAECQELGVAEDFFDTSGLTLIQLVTLARNEIRSSEDLAGCASDDLVGWTEKKDKEVIRHEGILSGLGVSRAEADALILAARVKSGWLSEEDLVEKKPDAEDEAPPVAEESEQSGEAVEVKPARVLEV